MADDNEMALAYKADAEIYQAKSAELQTALVGLLVEYRRLCDVFVIRPETHKAYLDAKEALDE